MPRQLRVFLCHASQDKPAVRELYKRLKAEAWIDPWLDEEKLLGGQDFDLEIYKAARDADAIIICLSKKSVLKEGYVNKEIRRALEIAQEKPEGVIYVIPLRLDECSPSFEQLKKLQWVDYFSPNAHEKLLHSLRARAVDLKIKIPDKKIASASDIKQKSNFDLRRFGLIGIIALALLFGGLSLRNFFRKLPAETSTPTLQAFTETSKPPTETSASLTPTLTETTSLSATPTTVLGIGSTPRSLKDNMLLVYVPAGEFTMGGSDGDQDERPAHQVYLDAFWMDQTEVTNAMYAKCVDANQCNPPDGKRSRTRSSYFDSPEFGDYPVISISWNDALAYCSWVGRRLPTEAEWEKAAHGSDGRIYPWGNAAPKESLLNYNNSIGDTTRVGSYPDGKSIYGALDMAGNVWEWVSSLYEPYPYDAADGREDLTAIGSRVLRGGSWSSDLLNVRSASRDLYDPTNSDINFGFRCALDPRR